MAYRRSSAFNMEETFRPEPLWRLPMLVIHGQLDFRIPVEQGIGAFTALQRRGIASRFVYFPDENHWILKPANSVRWHDEVNAWLKQYLGSP